MAGRRIPHFPIWVDDTLAHLQENLEPTVATGARFRLWLIAYRRGGRLRDDDKALASWAGLSLAEWLRIREYVVSGWEYDAESGTFLIKRLAQEVERQHDLSAKAKANAEARWRTCDRNATAMRPHPNMDAISDRVRNASPSPSQSLKRRQLKAALTAPPAVDGVDNSPPKARNPDQDSSPRASAPEETKPARAGPNPTSEECERLDRLRKRILASKELAGHLGSIDRVILAHLRRGAPCSAIEQGLTSVLKHKPPNPAAYLAKVLRVEVPNHHEAAAITRHQALKEAEARARSAPTAAGAQSGLEQVRGPIASVLERLAAKARSSGG